MRFLKIAGLLLAFLGCAAFLASFFLLRIYARTPDFRRLAEQKVGEVLKAEVSIGEIRIGFFNQVTFSGIQIRSASGEPQPYQIQVGELVFRYNMVQLLTHRLQLPSGITLKSPKLSLDEEGFPYRFFGSFHSDKDPGSGVRVRFDGGEVRCFLPGLKSGIYFKDLLGTVEPRASGILAVDLEGTASGFVSGRLRVRGTVNPADKTHRLEVDLEGIHLAEAVSVPLEKLEGKVRWENDNFYFDKIGAKFYGWDTRLGGSIERLSGAPKVALEIRSGIQKMKGAFDLAADFETGELNSRLELPGLPPYRAGGKVSREGLRLTVEELILNEAYRGRLVFDLESGRLNVEAARERKRITLETSLKDLDVRLKLGLDHVNLFGMDLVTYAIVRLAPIGITDRRFSWRFNGDFETQYFILHTLPFDDFQGHFEIGPGGMKNLSAFWGDVFRAEGELALRKKVPHGNLTVFAKGFDLSKVKEFASKPLPRPLGGMLDGRLRFEGDMTRPEIFGNFSVTEGWIGKLSYDRGLFSCHGFAPYLPVQDSKILRGRTTLYLTGALNLASMDLMKMFKGVEVQTADKIVIWKGWDLNSSLAEGDLEVAQNFLKLPAFVVKTKLGTDEGSGGENQKYQDEQYVVLGPKVKF